MGDPGWLAEALADVAPGIVAITALTRMETESENIRANGEQYATSSRRCPRPGALKHVELMTGLKHYLGPFEAYDQGDMPDMSFHEDEERLP